MKFGEHLRIAVLMTVVTTVLLGLAYPLAITGLAQALFPDKANGQLIRREDRVIGSRIVGQPFSGRGYFHSRPSAAGTGYDATASGGSNLGPTNRALINRVTADVVSLSAENPGVPVPIDLVTTSASGLDPDISLAAADFQMARVARERGTTEEQVRALVAQHTHGRQWGFLGEPRVNVLELNLALDTLHAQTVFGSRDFREPTVPQSAARKSVP
jgi:potassium-transporting ATPase KdpC subunit